MSLLSRQRELPSTLRQKYSFPELVELTRAMLEEYTGATVYDTGLEEELRKKQEEHRRLVSKCIRTCCSGNFAAKETVREIIKSFLQENLLLQQEDVERIIPFSAPEKMTPWQLMETIIFYLDKEFPEQGFFQMNETFDFCKTREGTGGVVTEGELRVIYSALEPKISLTEQFTLLAQLLFARTAGLGVIDTLNQQKGCIEEIQIGMSGRLEQRYDYKEELSGQKNDILFNRDGVHILVKGCTVWLKFLSFGTEEELQRVLRNLIKDSPSGELTKNHPMIVVDTVDGRRVSVSRPPMTDTWVGLVRKFDTVREVTLEELYRGYPEEKLVTGLLRWLVRSGRNIAITGEMASGKTTLFRACLVEARRDFNIRVVESESFELNVRDFLPNANCLTMRVTEKTPAEEVLAFARKTTGQIFAVGEINSAAVAAMTMDLSKIASQLFFSAHYITTEHMIADFVNAKLCVGGYSEERLAELDVVRCLGFDIHMKAKQGKRYIQYINEVIPVMIKKDRKEKTYEVRMIYCFDEERQQGMVVNLPDEMTFQKAKQLLSKEEYREFCEFFEDNKYREEWYG